MDNQNALVIPEEIADILPLVVKTELAKLPAVRQEEFFQEYTRKMKKMGTAYLRWFFFGSHYLYLEEGSTQWIFWCTLGGFWFWWLIDLVRIQTMINNKNRDLAINVLRDIKLISSL